MSEILTLDQHVDALAANLPSGRVWRAKHRPGSNLRGLLMGMAPIIREIDRHLESFVQESIPPTTEAYLSEWEAALGIPDDCFPVGATIAARQFAINVKLVTLVGISTEKDFEELAALFGLVIKAKSGIDHLATGDGGYETETPLIPFADFGSSLQTARMTLVISESFPEDIQFPWPFSAAAASGTPPVGLKFATAGQNSLRCLIAKLVPANVDLIFKENV